MYKAYILAFFLDRSYDRNNRYRNPFERLYDR